MKKAILFTNILVIDPDTQNEIGLSVYKHEGGGIFAIDSSYIDQCVNMDDYDRVIIPDPFSDNEQVVLFE